MIELKLVSSNDTPQKPSWEAQVECDIRRTWMANGVFNVPVVEDLTISDIPANWPQGDNPQ